MKKKINENLELYFTNNYPYVNKNKSNKKYTAILGIGGNIGDVKKRFNMLFNMLKKDCKIKVLKTSPILKNPPFGYLEQNYFYNSVILIKTNLAPYNLLKLCWYYENKFKRKRSFKDAPRTLDIDIIKIQKNNKDLKINTKDLIIPHIDYKNRLSVTIPLKYIS